MRLLRSVTALVKEAVKSYQYDVGYSYSQGETRFVRLRSAWFTVKSLFSAFTCFLLNHSYLPDGADYIESGGEGFSCTRCGHSFTAWH